MPVHSLRPILLVALLALSSCASQSPQSRTPSTAAAERELTGNPDQLAANALQALADGNGSAAVAAIARANLLAPNRADLAWLHARICMVSPGCRPEQLEARLRKLDPENAVVWLGPLARAQAQHDKPVEEQILEAMSRAQRFDLYWNALVWRLSTARATQTPPPANPKAPHLPLTQALDQTTEALSSAVVPAFKPLSTSCSLERTQEPTTRSRCERIAQAMQRSDTTLVEGLGIGIARRLATANSPEAIVLDERAATLSYRTQASGAVVRAQVEREKFSAEMIELMKKLPREQDVAVAILRWAGEPLIPQQ